MGEMQPQEKKAIEMELFFGYFYSSLYTIYGKYN